MGVSWNRGASEPKGVLKASDLLTQQQGERSLRAGRFATVTHRGHSTPRVGKKRNEKWVTHEGIGAQRGCVMWPGPQSGGKVSVHS